MASMRTLLGVLLTTFVLSLNCGLAITPRPIRHYVNGRQGWVTHPFQDYNQWAGNQRFLPHDTLYFRYNKEEDSVLEVNKQDYDNCNTDNPIEKKQDGESEFDLNQPGPYYFISGNKSHCQQGQKLIVQVLHYPSSLPSPPSSSPGTHHHPLPPPGSTSPSSGTPVTPGAPATSPSSGTPVTPGAPATSPVTPGSPATSPSSGTPVTPGSPATSPSSSTPVAPGPATSPSSGTPATSGPASSPTSGSGGPVLSPSGAASPPSPVAPGPGSAAPEAAGGPGSAAPGAAGGPGSAAPGAAGGPGSSAPGAAGGPGSAAPGAAGGPGSAETPSGQPSDITAPSPSEKKNSAVRSNGVSVGIGVLLVLVSTIMWLN